MGGVGKAAHFFFEQGMFLQGWICLHELSGVVFA